MMETEQGSGENKEGKENGSEQVEGVNKLTQTSIKEDNPFVVRSAQNLVSQGSFGARNSVSQYRSSAETSQGQSNRIIESSAGDLNAAKKPQPRQSVIMNFSESARRSSEAARLKQG